MTIPPTILPWRRLYFSLYNVCRSIVCLSYTLYEAENFREQQVVQRYGILTLERDVESSDVRVIHPSLHIAYISHLWVIGWCVWWRVGFFRLICWYRDNLLPCFPLYTTTKGWHMHCPLLWNRPKTIIFFSPSPPPHPSPILTIRVLNRILWEINLWVGGFQRWIMKDYKSHEPSFQLSPHNAMSSVISVVLYPLALLPLGIKVMFRAGFMWYFGDEIMELLGASWILRHLRRIVLQYSRWAIPPW